MSKFVSQARPWANQSLDAKVTCPAEDRGNGEAPRICDTLAMRLDLENVCESEGTQMIHGIPFENQWDEHA